MDLEFLSLNAMIRKLFLIHVQINFHLSYLTVDNTVAIQWSKVWNDFQPRHVNVDNFLPIFMR